MNERSQSLPPDDPRLERWLRNRSQQLPRVERAPVLKEVICSIPTVRQRRR